MRGWLSVVLEMLPFYCLYFYLRGGREVVFIVRSGLFKACYLPMNLYVVRQTKSHVEYVAG